MKYPISLAFFIFISFVGFAQDRAVVDWSYEAEAINDTEYELQFTASIRPGWYLYSQYLEEGGPIPTTIKVHDHPLATPIGQVEESGEAVEGFDELFQMQVKKFKKKAVFTQRIRIEQGLEEITGYIEFMSCDDEKCLPPSEVTFTISFRG